MVINFLSWNKKIQKIQILCNNKFQLQIKYLILINDYNPYYSNGFYKKNFLKIKIFFKIVCYGPLFCW